MLVLKIKPCMPKYRWINNRNCGWLNKSVIINLVKIIIKRITLLIVELIHEYDNPHVQWGLAFISSISINT